MNTVLWMQNESPCIPDTILIDGKISQDMIESQKAFSLLNIYNRELMLTPADRDKLCKENQSSGISHQLNYNVFTTGVYLQGCFIDTDNAGRKLPYMFFDNRSKSIDEGIAILLQQATSVGRTCNQKELSLLSELSKSNNRNGSNKKKIGIFIIFLFLIILFVYGII